LRAIAGDIVARATCAVARDARSYEVLKEIVGNRFDPTKHLVGTDMAFRLPTIDPSAQALEVVERARTIARGAAVAGFNISGLIANAPESWREYRFRDDYFATCVKLVSRLLATGAGAVVLVPHVVIRGSAETESDIHASEKLLAALSPAERERVVIAQGYEFPTEAKAIIKRLDWFSGSRLHATIGSLSNGVSTATIAYSDKARGIFEALGVGDTVADPRVLSSDEVVEHQVRCFAERDRHRAAIAERLPGILAIADRQMDDIARLLKTQRA
jgi:polysaccharide pyruvyl transferase WcaK-like protein